MGRSYESVRMGVNATAERWMRARKYLREGDRAYAERLSAMAKKHASACFYNFDDPVEAAIFSVLIEIAKEVDRIDVDL
jgi:hypothetical protein